MSTNDARAFSTMIIWAAFTAVMLGVLATADNTSTGFMMIFGIMLGVMAMSATRMVWKYSRESDSPENSEKAKRRNRLDKFVDNLSPNEIEDLRERLSSESDGEVVSLDDVLRRQR